MLFGDFEIGTFNVYYFYLDFGLIVTNDIIPVAVGVNYSSNFGGCFTL
jgi:hypothetical protein